MTHEKLNESVKRILWENWDPIGVNDIPEAIGEYDSYAPSVTTLLLNGADVRKIRNHLHSIETTPMGMNGDLARCEDAAQLLTAVRDTQGPN